MTKARTKVVFVLVVEASPKLGVIRLSIYRVYRQWPL